MLRGPVEAVVFDMDGLLIDSEAVYIVAMQEAARALRRDMPLALCHAMAGVPGHERYLMAQTHFGADLDIAALREHFSANVRRLLAESIPLKPGAVELLDFLDEAGLPRAVASSALRATIESHLGRAGLLPRLTAYAGRDDVARPKPAPDVYLEAARRLGVAPGRCVAFEDSSIGLAAAHAAGMQAIIVPDLMAPTTEARAQSVAVLADLHEGRELLRRALSQVPSGTDR
jgi:HAD superfamily hydrolase (TIGR01509 family)